ncbi:MAG: alpha/beta hydrolase [archaeon]
MHKENLVIVHSFPTNSTIMHGVKEFLDDYFNVYLVDLPGFNLNVPPLKSISLNNFSNFLSDYIVSLGLDSYFLGGISFGYFIANNCKVDSKCKGIIAMEPYLNYDYLKFNPIKKIFLTAAVNIICGLKLHHLMYNSGLFHWYLSCEVPKKLTELTLHTIDAYTFFETGKAILQNNIAPHFHDKPYILFINENDTSICAKKIVPLFKNLKKTLIISTTSAHYPKDISKEYFSKTIGKSEISNVVEFCRSC